MLQNNNINLLYMCVPRNRVRNTLDNRKPFSFLYMRNNFNRKNDSIRKANRFLIFDIFNSYIIRIHDN